MSTLASQPRTYTPDDLLAMPDAAGYELVDGKLVERQGSVESSRVAMKIGILLGAEALRNQEAVVYGSDLGSMRPPHCLHSTPESASSSPVDPQSRRFPTVGGLFKPISPTIA